LKGDAVTNVNDTVQARIAAARMRIEADRRRRAAQQAARDKGLARRHAAKLRAQANPRRPQQVDKPAKKETAMTERALTSAPVATAADDIRDHGYAIVQTRIERVPGRYHSTRCGQPDGCDQAATLVTFGLAEVNFEGAAAVGFRFARDSADEIVHFPTCDDHRSEASHVLGQHMDWGTKGDQS
jgi:hypothetical protein